MKLINVLKALKAHYLSTGNLHAADVIQGLINGGIGKNDVVALDGEGDPGGQGGDNGGGTGDPPPIIPPNTDDPPDPPGGGGD